MAEAALPPARGLGTFSPIDGGEPFAGLALGGHVVALAGIPSLAEFAGLSVRGLCEHWDAAWPRLAPIFETPPGSLAGAMRLDRVRALLPVEPRQIVCAGANYRRHVIEMMADHDLASAAGQSPDERRRHATQLMDHRAAHGRPFAFVKPISALLPPGEPLVLPADARQIDWEIELAVVIGRPCWRVARADALAHVAGYTIANDISARDRLARRDFPNLGLDWVAGKSAPGFLPLGPLIVPAALVADPQNLMLTLTLNGETMQQESSADMIFPIAQLIEHISTYMRLLPGDVVCTGSPSGNGTHYGRYLVAGDCIEARIEGLGSQIVRCVREKPAAGTPRHRPFVPVPEMATT